MRPTTPAALAALLAGYPMPAPRIVYPPGHRAPLRPLLRIPVNVPPEHPFDAAYRKHAEAKAAARARVLIVRAP